MTNLPLDDESSGLFCGESGVVVDGLIHQIHDIGDGEFLFDIYIMNGPEFVSPETFDSVVQLVDSDNESTRLAAVQLLALYLESVSGRSNTDQASISKRAYYHVTVRDDIDLLLQDADADVRAAAALVAGNLFFIRKIERTMMEAFDREDEQTVKMHLAWAYHHIGE